MQSPEKKPKRKLFKRDTEDKVQRALDEHAGHPAPTDIDSKLVDGLTLRAAVTRDFKVAKADGSRLGKKCR